jgi:hypothetical protein
MTKSYHFLPLDVGLRHLKPVHTYFSIAQCIILILYILGIMFNTELPKIASMDALMHQSEI